MNVHGSGKGGRNQEFALAAAVELAGEGAMGVLAAGTDGIAGPTDAAGAYVDGTTVATGTNVADLAIGLATTVTR